MEDFISESPLASLMGLNGGPRPVRENANFVAEAKECLTTPENQQWEITQKVGNQSLPVKNSTTYDQMLKFMKYQEMLTAKQAGFEGTNDEIIEKRKHVVSRNNVLHFI